MSSMLPCCRAGDTGVYGRMTALPARRRSKVRESGQQHRAAASTEGGIPARSLPLRSGAPSMSILMTRHDATGSPASVEAVWSANV